MYYHTCDPELALYLAGAGHLSDDGQHIELPEARMVITLCVAISGMMLASLVVMAFG